MKKSKKVFSLLVLFIAFSLQAQQTPAPLQTQDIAIRGAVAHLGNGKVINNSIVIIKNGKISMIADATVAKVDLNNMNIVEANGKHLYPGFIAPNSTLGLAEIDAVRATKDYDEVGAMNPHIRSVIAYNTESKIIESMRPNGVLMAQITPRGGRISGTSSVVQLDAWNWEDAILKENDGIHLNWPNPYSRGRWWLGEPAHLTPNKNYAKETQKLDSYFSKSKAYNAGDKPSIDLPFESLQGLIDGSKKLYIHVQDEKGITDAVHFSKKHQVKSMVIVGGYKAYKVISLLKEHNIPVLLRRVHSRPTSDDQDYDLPFKMAKRLVDNGILVGLENSGGMERMNTRNLPFLAGTCAAFGLDIEEALKLITLNTSKILGIDAFCGSIEVGKDATLFLSEGDALDMRTNKLTKAYIQGREISLESHQTVLYKRYNNKYAKD